MTKFGEDDPNYILKALKKPHTVLSYEKPQEKEKELSEQFMIALQSIKQYRDIKKTNKLKKEVIKSFEVLVNTWMDSINESKNENEKCKLLIYGSHVTGSALVDDDIDILIVAPEYCERNTHFFKEFIEVLNNDSRFSEIVAIDKAIVPIIKVEFESVKLDIGFASCSKEKLHQIGEANDEVLYNDKLLLGMEESTIKSYNAFRNAYFVYRSLFKVIKGDLIGEEERITNFKTTLLCIKLWAKRMGLYSTVLGYFGGISLAILVAKICQLYPNYHPYKLIERFFFIYQFFPWQKIPVLISNLNSEIDLEFLSSRKEYFKPSDVDIDIPGFKRSMYIITPAYPQMNSAYNINDNQLKIIVEALQHGFKMVSLISYGELSWGDLLLEYPFFHDYDFYIEIEILSINEKEFYMWKGLIQAKLRYLLISLDNEIENKVSFQLWPKEFDVKFPNQELFKFSSFFYIGVKSYNFHNSEELLNLTQIVQKWRSQVYEQWDYSFSDNRVYFFNKRKDELDLFIYTKGERKGFFIYNKEKDLMPKNTNSQLLSNLIPDNYGMQNMGSFVPYQMMVPNMNGMNNVMMHNGYGYNMNLQQMVPPKNLNQSYNNQGKKPPDENQCLGSIQ